LPSIEERVMRDGHCPKCGSSDVVARTVNDRLRAADPRGQTFEVMLQVLMWSCRACKLCWQGQEAVEAKETAYQNALVTRSPIPHRRVT
jgi:ribosomal protein L37AE/L43A